MADGIYGARRAAGCRMMAAVLQGAALCVDATHPYATGCHAGTSALQRCRRAWNTTACCVRKAPAARLCGV